MQRRASRRGHAEPGLSPVSWLSRTRCTFPYASSLVAQGMLVCCTAAALPAKTPQRADAAAQARCCALSRGRSVTTVPRQSSFPLSNRWRQPFRLVGAVYLVTQQSTLHTASSPPAFAEPTPPGYNGSDSHFSAPITPAAAAEAGSTPRGVGPRKRQAKRAVASSAAVETSAEQREEKGNSQGRQLSDASGEHRRPTDQSLSAAAPLQRVSQSAGKRESASDSEFNVLEALRLPAPPTRDTATPESICSYLLTLRRVVSVNRTGTHLVSITGRAALVFMRQILPSLMTMPPVPEADLLTGAMAATAAPAGVTSTTVSGSDATVKRSDPESGADSQSADTARGIRHAMTFAHPSFPPQSLPRASRQSTHEASPVSADVPKWYRVCGTGTVPWTEPLAEAVLLMCNRLNVEVRHLWIARAALLYLASVEGKDCADARQPLPTTLGATPSSLTRTLASALKDKAQLALALMRTLDRNRRQSRLTREVLRPVAMRSALRLRAKQNGAASAGGLGGCDGGGGAAAAVAASVGPKRGDTRVSGMDGDGKVPTPASLGPHGAATLMPQHASSFVNLERYLADKLLPLLYGEFVHYCHAVEQWRDNNLRAATQSTVAAATVAADTAAAAAAPAASRLYQHAPSPGALDDRAYLPNISRSDLESFSLLSAVLHRAIGLHGVVRCGDEVHFDLNEHSPDAYTPVGPRSLGIVSGLSGDVGPSADHPPCGRERSRGLLPAAGSVGAPPPPRSPQRQPAIPLRSFRITIEAVAARLDAAGGPHTGALESIASGGVRPYAMDGYAIQIDSPPPFVPPHSVTGAGVSRSPSDGSSGRFLSSSSSSTLRFGRPAAPSPARSPRAFSATAPSPAAGHKEHSDGSKGQDSTTRSSGAPHTTTTAPLSFKAFGNFNVDGFLPILSLCLHDYSFHLFLTAAADDTGARDVVRCATGNTSSVSPATAAEVSALVEEDVSALAAAVSRLLLLGVYWAPLCRTYQLPAVLALFARVTTSEPTHTNPEESASTAAAAAATMASLHPALSPPTAASLSTGATPVPLDTMVLRRVRGTLLPPSDSLATPSSPFVQQLCRLAYSSGCYMERVNFDTFARLTSILDRVLSQWPMQHADVTAAASTCSLSDTTNVGFGGASGDGVSGSGGVAAATAATASSGGELLLSAAATSGQSRDTVARAAGTTSVTGTVGTAVSHAKGSCAVFRAPPAAGMAVLHFFTPIAESFWSRERGRAMWQSFPRRARQRLTATSSVPFGRARAKGFLGFNTYTYPYTQLRVSVPHVAGDATAAPDGVRDVLPMPLYVLRQMGMNVGGAERTSTPDELLRVYQTSERVESYMAVLNGVGCATAARPFICEYLRSDFMWRAIPNDAFAPLVTAVMELELTSMAVPELLSLSGSLEDSAGPKHHHTASSSLPGRLSECLSPQTMMSLNARVEPHELRLLTADNEDTRTLYEETDVRKLLETVVTDSRHGGGKLPLLRFTLRRISRSGCVLESPPSSTTTSAAGPHTDGPGGTASLFTLRPAPHQGAQGARKLKRFPGTPTCHSFEWMADLLWEPAYSRSSDESARLPLTALPPILRAMTLLAEAERRVDGASPGSRACYSGPESLNVHNVELILRMAYRLLFDTVAEASAGAEPPTVVSLEALVTLYLSLTSVASQWGAASSPTRALGSHVATPKPAEKPPVAGERVREGGGGTRSSGLVFMSLAVDCCLAHCEDALRPRLMAIAHDTLVSGMDDAAPMKRESVATDLRVLLQLAVLAEGLLPCLANMAVSVTAEAGASVNELIHRQLFRELGASLREASLQKIAGEVSRMLWWVTRRAHAEVKVEGALPLSPPTSWTETLLLQEISAKRLPMADRAIAAADATAVPSAASWRSGMGRQSFDLFEWALLPFYAKLEARQNVSNSAASAMAVDRTSAAPPRPPPTPAPMLDDFLSLEDAYSEPAAELAAHVWPPQSSSHGLATGFSSGATTGGAKVSSDGSTTAFYPSGPSAAPHTATLEAALHALPFQCDSFHVLLHIVRQLFLSHPVLLSTAPEAVLYYELRTAHTAADDEKRITATSIGASAPEHIDAATVGRKAWATVPVQRAELPHGLRQRYVDTLFRFFKRLVHHHSCTAEELVELLHLLWLADPHASHVTSSGLSSSSTTVSTSQWPSLFAHCSSFVKASLAELDAAAAMRDTSDSFKGDNDPGASSPLLRSVPEVLQTVYRTAHYGLAKSITVKSREMHWISVNAAALHPRSVVFFLQCLNTVVRGLGEHRQQRVSAPQSLSMPRLQHHEQQERTHHSLSCSHRSALELFQPFIICASITGEPMAGVAKLCYVPLMLEALSQMDPKLLLVVIQTVFTGAAWSGEGGRDQHDDGGGGGGGAVNSRREVASAGSGHFYRKALAGSQTGLGSTRMREKGHIQSTRPSVAGGLQTSQRLSESIAATMAALLMVASYAQASSRVWAPSGGAGGDEDADSTVATTPATPQRTPLARIGRAQRSALIFLRSSLFELLSLARSRHPLQCVSAFTVVQVMQLTVVQESPRLARLLEWILLSQLLPPVLRVERDIFPAATNRPPRCGSGYVATPLATLPKFSTPPPTAATPARHDSLNKYGVTITEDTIGRMRFPATHQSVLLLRLLPVQCWRSLLHRNVCWPRYRGYSLQVSSRRLRSPVVTRGETHTADTARDRSIAKWNEVRSSLASLLLSLDLESIECLVAEAMGPMVLLVVTTELLRVVARQRTCSGDNLTTLRRDAEGLTRAVGATLRSTPHADDCQLSKADKGPASIAEPSGAAKDTPSPAALTSYEVVHCYASPGSVLTDEAVQPWLKAACNVIDQLASTRHTDFVAVLEREAAWQRRVTEASTYQGGAAEDIPLGVYKQTAVEAMKATRAVVGATRGGAPEDAAPVLDIGEDGLAEVSDIGDSGEGQERASLGASAGAAVARDDLSALGSSGGGGTTTMGFVATKTTVQDSDVNRWLGDSDKVAAQPLVLDWRPIAEFMRVVRQVDPGISQRQVRLEWWMRQPALATGALVETLVAQSASLAEAALVSRVDDAHDVLHNAISATLQHTRQHWQAADRVDGVQPLLMMNLRDALNIYPSNEQNVCSEDDSAAGGQLAIPMCEDGAAEAASRLGASAAQGIIRDSVEVVEQARWLEYGADSSVFVDGSSDPATPLSGFATTVVLGLARPCSALSVSSIHSASTTSSAATVDERKRRRLVLLRRAGVLASVQEMEQRYRAHRLSGAMWRDGTVASEGACEANFWRQKSQQLQREMLRCIFGGDDSTAGALQRSHASDSGVASKDSAGASGEEVASAAGQSRMNRCMSDLERSARHRLQLLRCNDLAQLLLLLMSATSAASPPQGAQDVMKEGTDVSPSLRGLQIRVVMDTMAELLPSASTGELMQVALALLKLSISATTLTGTASTDATTPQLLHEVHLEARRLLANVAVLVANDVERFTLHELLWLITRLHTPCIRAAPAVAVPPHAQSTQQADNEAAEWRKTHRRPTHDRLLGDEPLDVSMSYVSVAVARAIRVGIEGSSAPTGGERGDNADADDEDDDGTGGSCDEAAALDGDVSVHAQSVAPVTVAQWVNAVAAAERLQGRSHLCLVLRLVERSAV